jgi:hypothetical protein
MCYEVLVVQGLKLVDSCEHGKEHLGSKKGREFLDHLVTNIFSRRTLLHSYTVEDSLSGMSGT